MNKLLLRFASSVSRFATSTCARAPRTRRFACGTQRRSSALSSEASLRAYFQQFERALGGASQLPARAEQRQQHDLQQEQHSGSNRDPATWASATKNQHGRSQVRSEPERVCGVGAVDLRRRRRADHFVLPRACIASKTRLISLYQEYARREPYSNCSVTFSLPSKSSITPAVERPDRSKHTVVLEAGTG